MGLHYFIYMAEQQIPHDITEQFALAIPTDMATMELRQGVPVCTIDQALKLAAAFNDRFPGTGIHILPKNLMPAEGERGLFANAHAAFRAKILAAHGYASLEEVAALPKPEKDRFIELLFPRDGSTPDIIRLLEREPSPRCVDDLFAKCDPTNENGLTYLRTALEDTRVDLASLLTRMSQHMQIRSLFAGVYPDEPEELRESFMRCVDELMARMSQAPVGPVFVMVRT